MKRASALYTNGDDPPTGGCEFHTAIKKQTISV